MNFETIENKIESNIPAIQIRKMMIKYEYKFIEWSVAWK